MKPVSSIEGKIEEIYMAIDSSIPSPAFFNYLPIIEAFGCDVRFLIMVRGVENAAGLQPDPQVIESSINEVNKLLRYAGKNPDHHLVFFSSASDRSLNTFVQDPFFSFQVLPQGVKTILLKPFPSEDFTFYTDELASHSDCNVKPSPILFEGGNILVGDDFILVGQDSLLANFEFRGQGLDLLEYVSELDQELRATFGVKEVIWIGAESTFQACTIRGEASQPLVHIDLYVTLGGLTDMGKQLVYVGEPRDEFIQGEPNECTARIQKELDAVAQQLAARKRFPIFEVRRIPMALRALQENSFNIWSYNNTQAEAFDGFKRVYLPQYQSEDFQDVLDQTNRLAREAFFDGGFDIVKTISAPILNALVSSNGSLHCITKVLKRSAP